MVAQWTGKIEPGTKTDLLSVHIDVLPTLCKLVGTEPEGNIDDISFLPTLLGGGNQKQHAFFYWEFPAWLFKCDVQCTIVRNAICGRLHKENVGILNDTHGTHFQNKHVFDHAICMDFTRTG